MDPTCITTGEKDTAPRFRISASDVVFAEVPSSGHSDVKDRDLCGLKISAPPVFVAYIIVLRLPFSGGSEQTWSVQNHCVKV